ncbi:MAG: 3-keto-disaccharide hydrolase [Gemmataceae bacterium]
MSGTLLLRSSWLVVLTALLSLALRSAPNLCAEDAADDWKPLFNGKDLDGWVQRGGKAQFRVEDQQIVGTSVPNTSNSFLCTTRDYGDFALELEFKVDPKLNSGVQVRSHCFEERKTLEVSNKRITIPAGRVHGYQVEIDPSARAWTGGIYDEGRRGWLQDLKDEEPARKAFRQKEWNKLRIACRGDAIQNWLNGVRRGFARSPDALRLYRFTGPRGRQRGNPT